MPENYYTSYWPIEDFPETFYLYQFKSEKQAKLVYFSKDLFHLVAKISNVLVSFCSELPLTPGSELNSLAKTPTKFEIKTKEVLEGYELDAFPTHRDATNHFKALLGVVVHDLMKRRKLSWYPLADGNPAYFFTPNNLKHGRAVFKFPISGKRKRKNLFGKYLSLGKWHYAISARPILSPILGYSLKSHILFTTDGFKPWVDKDKMHSHRRSKGRRMFNEEWRDMLLAFLSELKSDEQPIQLTDKFTPTMTSSPICLGAEFGYIEPKGSRYDVLQQTERADPASNHE